MNKAIFAVMICLVTVALVGGFRVVGGPEQARAETRDRERASLMYRHRTYLMCTGQRVKPLPERLGDTDYCPNHAAEYLVIGDGDAVIEGSLSYTRISDAAFVLCAGFESSGFRLQRILRPFPLLSLREDGAYCIEGGNGFES